MNKKEWNKPDASGRVDVPDELMPLLNKFMVQCHLHATAKGMRIQGIVNMVDIAERFFASKSIPQPDQLPDVGKTMNKWDTKDAEIMAEQEIFVGFEPDVDFITVHDIAMCMVKYANSLPPTPLTDQQFADELDRRWINIGPDDDDIRKVGLKWLKRELLKPQ